MRKPTRHLIESVSTNVFSEKIHHKKEVLHDKSQQVFLNQKLFNLVEKASDQKNVVLADIVRTALKFYIKNPKSKFDSSLIQNNVKLLNFKITRSIDATVEQYKINTGINRSILYRRALSAWLIHEKIT